MIRRVFSVAMLILAAFASSGCTTMLLVDAAREPQVRVLGLDGLFDETTLLDTTAVGADTKKACFKEILDSRHLKAEEVLCVGDRMDRELKVARELGIPTAMVRHGRHYRRFSSNSTGDNEDAPDTYIESVTDLPGILDR